MENDRSCMFPVDEEAAGPFPTSNWAVYVLPEHVHEMTWWMHQRRGDLSLLIHPNTGCEIEDHSIWALWGGAPWPLDLSVMSHDEPFPWEETRQ
eukprot:CAMPEP_0202965412 /NCGR_PEP_ID=MMETSP1396-20130829/9393_1 /ASSEMBLY_ACC=CAM_ASM_000872 /TAXON_ID= /ORGANISM="Pseudokeronopsis sp., Strain Brazil" /LENGTH=93 /DNA_ID=CAMNT_0049688115 /DNA_START=236 /DNA_END=520 /DNA_ORIENTATION=-